MIFNNRKHLTRCQMWISVLLSFEQCHMPLGMPWGRAVIRHAGRNATFVAVLSPPSFTLDPSAEDPVRTFKIFPTLEPGNLIISDCEE